MKYSIIVALTLVFLFAVVETAYAVPFNVTSTPTSLNAGQTSQLINFTISNNGTVSNGHNFNITQVNITLPPDFVFTGSSGTTTTLYSFSSNPISWTNTSSIGIVERQGGTQYFWIYVNTPITTGSYGFNVTVLDANNVYNSTNVTISLVDTLAPTFTNNITSPSSNSTYVPNQEYWFNVTWTDGVSVSKVLLEHNFTGATDPHNDTMSNTSNVFYTKFTDLSAGNYVWRVYANDTTNNFNSTSQRTYIIRQAPNTLRVFLNGTLNNNITSINNTAVNVTVNASCAQTGCTITIVLDSTTTLVSTNANPVQYISTLTSIGSHNYSTSVTSNTNYTSNSTTYFVATTPSYSTSTNLPLTWSNTTSGSLNITFGANAALQTIVTQGDWSGTSTNYTMSNTSAALYFYNIIFPAGTFSWKIYGTYSNHTFNLTVLNNFTINKATPTINLNITPQWTLDSPAQTNVSCTISVSGLTLNLYRNGTGVSNPDIQTFKAGDIYAYLCNSTSNQNYTVGEGKNTLTIRPKPVATLSFVDLPSLIEVVQNSIATTQIKVKNIGGVSQNVTVTIIGIDKNWYSLQQSTITILSGLTGTFVIDFKIADAEVKDYTGTFEAQSVNTTISQNFTLRILPSDKTKVKINDSLAVYKLETSKLENRVDQLKSQGFDVSSLESRLNELKSEVNQTNSYINSNDYFNAYLTIQKIKALNSEIDSKLTALEQPAKIKIPQSVWMIILGVIGAVIIGIIVYLFWPVKEGYRPEKGEYVKGRPSLWEKIKKFFSRKKEKEIIIPES